MPEPKQTKASPTMADTDIAIVRIAPETSFKNKAYEALKEAILKMDIYATPEPVMLDERALSERLGVSRTPIREAIAMLEQDGFVKTVPRRGIVVAAVDPHEQLRLLEVRREIERLMARTAARRADPEQRGRLCAVAGGMEQAASESDETAFLRLDRELNLLVIEATRNEFAAAAMGLMHGLSRRFWYQHYKEAADLPLAARLHADVAEAIAERRVDAAGAASDSLIDYIESFARSTL